jgi:hypothetical protein
MTITALVDYDNVRSANERTAYDARLNLEDLVSTIVGTVLSLQPKATDLELRLYGGWIDENSRYSALAQWLLACLPDTPRRRGRLRVRTLLAVAPLCAPEVTLVGLVRLGPNGRRQKMVDSLLLIDLVHLMRERSIRLMVVSDDDDFVPGAVAATRWSKQQFWLLRKDRKFGAGPNDGTLVSLGVGITTLVQ